MSNNINSTPQQTLSILKIIRNKKLALHKNEVNTIIAFDMIWNSYMCFKFLKW